MSPSTEKRLRLTLGAIAIAVLAVGLWVVFTYNPEEVYFFPKCPTKWVTDYNCPGCGTTRALHALLHGNIAGVWHYNAALFFYVPLIILTWLGNRQKPGNLLRRLVQGRWYATIVLVTIIIWGIGRNIIGI